MEHLSDRQKEIITTAIKIIAERGIFELTTKNIAKEIGFSEAAIYKHFESKADILMALLDYFENQADRILEKLKNTPLLGFAKIREIFMERCVFFEKNPYYTKVIFSEEIFQNDENLAVKIKSIMKKNWQMVMIAIDEIKKQNDSLKDFNSEDLATVIMGSFRLLVTQWRISGFRFGLKARCESLMATLENMIFKNCLNRG